jgi:acetoacetate decarboxylase
MTRPTSPTAWISSASSDGEVSYPPAPWEMVGQLWLSLFRVREPVDDLRPAGTYGAAFVSYEPGSPLTYSELLVARLTEDQGHGRCVTITDIWVDSPASVAGGRELWAIPKELCDFELDTSHRGPLSSTDWAASYGRRPIVSASFTDVSRAMVRLPFKGGTWQPGIDDTGGEERTGMLQGSSRALPCRGRWDFAPDGPLGWLSGARQLASFRQADFRMSFA